MAFQTLAAGESARLVIIPLASTLATILETMSILKANTTTKEGPATHEPEAGRLH